MWIMARYLPVAPFSLKPVNATSSGGKTLLAPTPYAIKMALLDVALRTLGVAEGERLFPFLRDLAVAIDLPRDLVVMKGFSKIRRPVESKDAQKKRGDARRIRGARARERGCAHGGRAISALFDHCLSRIRLLSRSFLPCLCPARRIRAASTPGLLALLRPTYN